MGVLLFLLSVNVSKCSSVVRFGTLPNPAATIRRRFMTVNSVEPAIIAMDCRRANVRGYSESFGTRSTSTGNCAADQVAVEEIERTVTDELSKRVPNIDRAESLTFRALHLIAGNIDPTVA